MKKRIINLDGRGAKTTPLNFLILSCSAGAGHTRAGEALHRFSSGSGLPIRTEHHDVLDFTPKYFKRAYTGSYIKMVNSTPELWGYLFEKTERKSYKKQCIVKAFDKFNYGRYLRMLKRSKPDAIICTHFLPYISIADELKKNGISSPFFAVTTDFDIHRLWVDPVVEKYFVHHDESAWQLGGNGVPDEKIAVTGIPVMPGFQERGNKNRVRKKLGLVPDRFTILVLSGGFGVGRVGEIAIQINRILAGHNQTKFNLLIVSGKNERLRDELESTLFPGNVRGTIYGFVDNVDELMDAADLLVSKPGGLTSAEAMAKSLPILIVDPIPGQESRNADIIVEQHAGWKAINVWNLGYKLEQILDRPALLAEARKGTSNLGRPDAALSILNGVYDHLTGGEITTQGSIP